MLANQFHTTNVVTLGGSLLEICGLCLWRRIRFPGLQYSHRCFGSPRKSSWAATLDIRKADRGHPQVDDQSFSGDEHKLLIQTASLNANSNVAFPEGHIYWVRYSLAASLTSDFICQLGGEDGIGFWHSSIVPEYMLSWVSGWFVTSKSQVDHFWVLGSACASIVSNEVMTAARRNRKSSFTRDG